MHEKTEQILFIDWFKSTFPDVRIAHIPNGVNAGSKAKGSVLKWMGVSKGFPDIIIPAWFVCIEMKKQKGGKVSEEQREWLDYLNAVGYTAVVCNGEAEARRFVEGFYEQMRKQ